MANAHGSWCQPVRWGVCGCCASGTCRQPINVLRLPIACGLSVNSHVEFILTTVDARLRSLGLLLPAPMVLPPGVLLPFDFVLVRGTRVLISGHGPQNADGTVAGPLGKLGTELTVEQGYHAARLAGLSILSSLQRALGDLERVRAWQRVFGMVNSAPGFHRQPSVINGFSDLILELYGPERGAHTRSAVGLAELPFNIPVEIEAELEIHG